MSDAARYYVGEVSHKRFGQIDHSFRYRIAYLLLDLDRTFEAGRLTRLLRIGKPGLMAFDPFDHGDGQSTDLAEWVRVFLQRQGIEEPAAKIELLTLPRMFGYVFNPISVYFIRDQEGRLHHFLYEVGNTFGERHFYLCAVQMEGESCEHACDKAFYVSPFFGIEGQYDFKVSPPGEAVRLSIAYRVGEEARLNANFVARARPVTGWTSFRLLLGFPFMTFGVIAGIHWEALKLWLKGARYHRHGPKATTAGVSYVRSAGATSRGDIAA